MNNAKSTKGITLIALVVTIVVLLILAGVSISTVLGNNGIIPRANEAKFKTELASIQEEFTLYVTDKTAENSDFSVGSLNASSDLLTYNTQPDEEKGTGNISSVLKSATAQKYIQTKNFSIIKGDLIYASQNAKELEWAQEVGLAINPYNIDENGVLLSSDTNLMLMDEATGTLVIPEMVKAIGEGAFANVTGLKRIIIPPTVNEIKANAFRGNSQIEEVIIQANEELGLGVKYIGTRAFAECKKLATVNIPNTVTSFNEGVFSDCSSLVEITLSKNANVKATCFNGCTSLENIVIPEGVTSITGWGTFYACSSLKTVTLPSTLRELSGTCFDNCLAIENIIFSGSESQFIFEEGILLSKDRSTIYVVTSKAVGTSKEFRIPEGVRTIQGRLMISYRFTKVYFPASLESFSPNCFPSCVTEIEVSPENKKYTNYNGNIVSKDKTILYVCTSKSETINIDGGIREVTGSAVFHFCENAKVINFSDSVEEVNGDSIFLSCRAPAVKFGKSFTSFDFGAFGNSNGLRSVEISPENPEFSTDGISIYNKTKTALLRVIKGDIKELVIPNTVTEIASKSIETKHELTKVEIPNTVKSIRDLAFSECYRLTELYIPESVDTIGNNAFTGCNKLNQIRINKRKGEIAGSPWGVTIGERAIKWLK